MTPVTDPALLDQLEQAPGTPVTDPSLISQLEGGAAPDVGKLESFVRGGAQGASLGYADEITGALGAAKDKLAGSDQDLADLYRQERDDSRNNYASAETSNPKTYKTGEFGGGIASLALAPEATGLKGLAALGAVSGLGNSNADLTKGEVGQAAEDTAIGGALGAGGHYVGKAISAIPGAFGSGVKKAMSSVLGPSVEAIDARLTNNSAIRQAGEEGLEGIAEKIPGAIGSMKGQMSDLATKATDTLRSEPSAEFGGMRKWSLINQISKAQDELATNGQLIGEAKQAAFNKLDNIKNSIAGIKGDMLPESTVKSLIQDIDPNINYADPLSGPANSALKSLRGSLSSQLKEGNPEYADAMAPISQRAQVVDYLTRKMNLKNVPGEGPQPTDATLSSLKNVLNENKGVTQDAFGKMKEFTGTDIPNAVQNYKYAQEFNRPYTNGSRNAVTGAAVGGAIGHFLPVPGGSFLGGAAGAMAGRYIDKEGGAIAGHAIDWYVEHAPQKLGQYAPVLQKALQKGTQALTAAHYVLQQQDPNYNLLMRGIAQ